MFIATKRALRGFISETSGNQLLTVSLLLISIPAYSSFKNSNTNNKALLLLLISWCLASCGHYNVRALPFEIYTSSYGLVRPSLYLTFRPEGLCALHQNDVCCV